MQMLRKFVTSDVFITFLLSIVIFHFLIGVKTLNPFNTLWLQGVGDAYMHNLGWQHFKNSVWSFPVGLIPTGTQGRYTSIVFTDSIPLFAIPAKLILGHVVANIQYIGIWIFVCYFLLLYFSRQLLASFGAEKLIAYLSAILISLNPLMLFRLHYQLGHPALMAHFLIVATLLISKKENTPKKEMYWFALLATSILVHAYIFILVFFVWTLRGCTQLGSRDHSALKVFIRFITCTVALGVLAYCVGYFIPGVQLARTTLTTYPTSFLNLFDPGIHSYGLWSILVPFTPQVGYHHEGLLFLGLSVLVMLPIALYFAVYKQRNLLSAFKLFPGYIYVACLVLFLVASIKMEFEVNGDIKLLGFEVSGLASDILGSLSIFRSNARLAWLAYYLLMFSTIILFISGFPRSIRAHFIPLVFGLMSILQFFDMRDGRLAIANSINSAKVVEFQTKLKSEFWQLAGKKYSMLLVLPNYRDPAASTKWGGEWRIFSSYTAFNGMTTNSVRSARSTSSFRWASSGALHELSKNSDCNTFAVIDETLFVKAREIIGKNFWIRSIDGYWVATPICN